MLVELHHEIYLPSVGVQEQRRNSSTAVNHETISVLSLAQREATHLVVETLERRCDVELLATVKLLLEERTALDLRVLGLVGVEEPLRADFVGHVHIDALGPRLLALELESIAATGYVEAFLASAIPVIHGWPVQPSQAPKAHD